MSINLIQNYVNTHKQTSNLPVKKSAPEFDIKNELENRAFIKPLKGKGKLVSGSILNAPLLMVKDLIYDVKSFKHALKGQANDHELGKINDIGMKIGGLGIASYLFTKRPTSMTKGMEFIGLGSFLASMAIWPKVALQLPAYLIHGVNINKEYQDSFGRRKPFYQDPQFIPWDLYSDEEIHKIGDRLGVDRKIPNRREFIQEKMKKIAIQNNTMWMLTAGFATPIMSALICNQTEPLLTKYFNKRQNQRADRIIANLDTYSDNKYQTHSIKKNLDKVIEAYKDKPINKDLCELITDTLSEGSNLVSKESLRKDVQRMLKNTTFSITDNTAKLMAKNFEEKFADKNFSEEFLQAVLPTEKDIKNILSSKKFLNKNIEESELKTITKDLTLHILEKVKAYNETVPEEAREDINYIKKLILNNKNSKHPILSALTKSTGRTFDSTLHAKLRNVANILDSLKSRVDSLDEYSIIKTGSVPETVSANHWNETEKEVLKIFGFTPKDIENVRADRSILDSLLREKIEKIVSDKTSYKTVLDKLTKQVSLLFDDIKASDMSAVFDENQRTTYEKIVDHVYDNYSKSISEAGFTDFAKALTGGADSVGSAKNIQKAIVSEKLLSLSSNFNRLINNLVYFRQVVADPSNIPALKTHSREAKEELVELCKLITLQGHSSDFATKFHFKRNPHPADDYSDIQVVKGRVKNKYFGKTKEVADIGGDKYFYQDAMRLMFETEIDADTMYILEKNHMKDKLLQYRNLMLEKVGGEYYFPKPNHLIRAKNYTASDIKYYLTGMATNDYFFNAIQKSFNSKKWLKTYGGFGAGLLGITVLSQFFFGKMKTPKQVKND